MLSTGGEPQKPLGSFPAGRTGGILKESEAGDTEKTYCFFVGTMLLTWDKEIQMTVLGVGGGEVNSPSG